MHLEKNLTIQTRRYLIQTFLDRGAIEEKEEDRGQLVSEYLRIEKQSVYPELFTDQYLN